MQLNNRLNEIRKVLYQLTIGFGLPVTFYHYTGQVDNVETGKEFVDFDLYYLPKVVILQSRDVRKFNYDLPFIATNKNFTYGGYFDESTRWMILEHTKLPQNFTVTQNDHITFAGNRYEVSEVHVYQEYKCSIVICAMLSNNVSRVKEVDDFIKASNFNAEEHTLAALDNLGRSIVKDVFAYSVPANFMLCAFCGDLLANALQCVWHPSGQGTALTNYNVTEAEYTEIGKRGGLQFAGVDQYLDTGFLFDEVDFDDMHMSIYGDGLQQVDLVTGDFAGASDGAGEAILYFDTDEFLGSCGLNTDIVSKIDATDLGHICISSEADNSLKLYINGVVQDTNVGVRTQVLPSLVSFLGASNINGVASNFTKFKVMTLTVGPKLTPAQVLSLYSAIHAFNLFLGRTV